MDFELKKTEGTDFKITFTGQLHQVNADTLISSLINISSVIQEINNEINPDKKINIKIKALSKGSFEILWGLQQQLIDAVNLLPSIDKTADILTILVGLLTIKEFLKGEKPKSVQETNEQEIRIENNNGNIIIINNSTFKIYRENEKANESINNFFDAAENEPAIEGLEIKGYGEHFYVPREIFPALAATNLLLEKNEDERDKILRDARLRAVKIVFEPGRKWEFIYSGIKISANITDEGFFNKISQGESFAKGDVFIADIKIKQKYDPSVLEYLNISYEITKIKDHLSRPQQADMGFGEQDINL